MCIWRFAGAFAVVKRQGECGSKTAGMHVSQPMNIDTMIKSKYNCIYFQENLYFCTAQKEDFSRYFVPKNVYLAKRSLTPLLLFSALRAGTERKSLVSSLPEVYQ